MNLKSAVEPQRHRVHREKQNRKARFDPADSIGFILWILSKSPPPRLCGSNIISEQRFNGIVLTRVFEIIFDAIEAENRVTSLMGRAGPPAACEALAKQAGPVVRI